MVWTWNFAQKKSILSAMQSALYLYIYAVSVTTYFRFSTFLWKPVAEVCYILCIVSVVPSISDQSTKRGCLLGAPRPGNYVHIALPSSLLYLLKCFVNFLLCFLTHSTTYKKIIDFVLLTYCLIGDILSQHSITQKLTTLSTSLQIQCCKHIQDKYVCYMHKWIWVEHCRVFS